ncbi:hypothetical protein H8F23_04155 [Pseudomonas sp. P155]|uniref:DUF1934 domain-containing protein n=1 Tax=Pseudomonas neuropathica TaxID=2730425 RepID=A0ABS0BD89_9PSED|nr:hypothetical protein [Pseudomonas neuropathica]MBF6032437.1 hypothetical protein [Pseudomonas neuropathica]
MSELLEASGYFIATQNGNKLFETERITIEHGETYITIQGSKELGFPNGEAIDLTIDSSTPNGEHEFKRGEKLREVFYLNRNGTQYANKGTFNSHLDNTNRKYRINFDLYFHGHTDPIKVELDVSE